MAEQKDAENQAENHEPIPPQIDEFQLAALVTKREIFFIIEKLRQGPIERGAFHKLVKAKFPRIDKSPRELVETLMTNLIIREFEYTKEVPNPDETPALFPDMKVGESRAFYLLVKDFYAIRKPPMELLEKLESSDIPNKIVKEFRKEIQEYFNKYTNKQMGADDLDVIQLFMDQKLVSALSYLTENIYQLGDISDQMKAQGAGEPMKIFTKLKEKDFIKIIEIPERKGSYVLLKTAIELKPVFPEYLIRGINQMMAEKKMDKNFALLTLNLLKRAYLELEKPDILKKQEDKVPGMREKLKPFIVKWQAGEKNQAKAILKIYSQILDIYKETANIAQIQQTLKDMEQFQEKERS